MTDLNNAPSGAGFPFPTRAETAPGKAKEGDQLAELREALTALLERYTQLVNCGDCGNWDPETEPCVERAREVLSRPQELADPAEPSDGERWRWFVANHPVTLVLTFFGNGCVNKTVDMAIAKIDADLRATPAEPSVRPQDRPSATEPDRNAALTDDLHRLVWQAFHRALDAGQIVQPKRGAIVRVFNPEQAIEAFLATRT